MTYPIVARETRIHSAVQRELEQAVVHAVPGDLYKWRGGEPMPDACHYERLTAIGVQRDYWDGYRWRRTRALFNRGVVCANQDLPWRIIRAV